MAEKTLKATPKKLRDARNKGQVPKSKEVIATAVLCALVLTGWAAGSQIFDFTAGLFSLAFDFTDVQRDRTQLLAAMERVGVYLALSLIALSALSLFAALVAGFMQTRGLVLSFDPIVPKFERLNPAENAKKLFSLKQVFELSRKLVVVGVFVVLLVWLYKTLLPAAAWMVYTPSGVPGQVARAMVLLFGSGTLVVLVAAAIDYGLQVYEFGRDQRMSLEEVRREHRDMEGDPFVKAQLRALRREMAQGRGRAAPQRKASVVLTNPTHVAVAVYYEPGGDPPRVIDKGLDAAALKIKEAARQAGVPVLEDPPLARRLYRAVAIDEVIDQDLFDAVAEVLVWAKKTSESNASGATQAERAATKPRA
jgi:type III secretion protein U